MTKTSKTNLYHTNSHTNST